MIVIGVVVMVMTLGVGDPSAQTTAPPPAAASAPDDEPGDITSEVALTRAAIQVRRQALVTAVMDFETKEAEEFWPLYREYRLAMAKVNDGFVKLVGEYL